MSARRKSAYAERRQRKAETILSGAVTEFLEHGYSGTSIDQIVARTGVSKPTVYAHFDSKEALFSAILRRALDGIFVPADAVPIKKGAVRDVLLEFAENYAKTVLSREVLALHRLIAAESQRYPEFGKVYYETGYIVHGGFTRVLERYAQLGDLQIEDSEIATLHFWGLVLGPIHNYELFNVEHPMSMARRRKLLKTGLDAFLRAYGPQTGTRASRRSR